MNGAKIIIRPYEEKDREIVRKICCDTAFMGEDVTVFFDDREVFADFAISYYTDYEPQSSFVAEIENRVIGYICGCCDTRRYYQIFNSRILPKTIIRSLARGIFLRRKTINFISNTINSLMKGEFKRPYMTEDYPAHLHINVESPSRHLGAGRMLMNKFLEYLNEKKVSAVHLVSISKVGQPFFSKLGFDVLYSQKITYFDYLIKEPLDLKCFGKKL